MIFDFGGTSLYTAYNKNADQLIAAYDINGQSVYTADPSQILKVATYNVGGWYIGSGTNVPTSLKFDYIALQKAILSAVDADIVCFQEYWNSFCADGTTADSVIGEYFTQQEKTNANTTWNGHVIASKSLSLSDYESIQFEHYYSAAPSYEKCYITVGGKRICIFNTHLSTAAGGQKEPQSQEMLEAVQDEPYFVLLGDFNTEASDYSSIVEKFVTAGYNSANLNGGNEWLATFYTSAGVGKPTDQIITSANIEIVDVYVNDLKLTDSISDKIDHIPLIAELRVT